MRRYVVPGACAAALAVAACGTQQIGPNPTFSVATEPGPEVGGLWIIFAPTADTYDEWQARNLTSPNVTHYNLLMDGQELVFDVDSVGLQPVIFLEGNEAGAGYIPAGAHRFDLVEEGGGATIFTATTEIQAGTETRLYLFGHFGALDARFTSHSEVPPPGTLHVSAINLVRGGAPIEVVACADTTNCTPMSAPLSLGDDFFGEFSAGDITLNRAATLDTGAAVGWRQVPTAAVPAPPVQPIYYTGYLSGALSNLPPANLAVAPIYMSADGNVQASF